MKRTKDRIPQLKTLEQLIVKAMKRNDGDNELRNIYEAVYYHYTNIDYLQRETLRAILECIYKDNYYKYCNVQALVMKFHLDNKKLLRVREEFLQLFTKFYFSLDDAPDDYRILLYDALINTRRSSRRKQR